MRALLGLGHAVRLSETVFLVADGADVLLGQVHLVHSRVHFFEQLVSNSHVLTCSDAESSKLLLPLESGQRLITPSERGVKNDSVSRGVAADVRKVTHTTLPKTRSIESIGSLSTECRGILALR